MAKQGVNVSQARAEHLKEEGHEVFLSPTQGFFVRTDNLTDARYTYHVHRTGDVKQTIPSDAEPY